MNGPDPTNKHPMAGFPRVCFIKNTISNPNIIVGDYTYYEFDYLVEVESEAVVRALAPDFKLLSKVACRGIIVTARAQPRSISCLGFSPLPLA